MPFAAKCLTCGHSFEYRHRKRGNYCSRACYYESKRGIAPNPHVPLEQRFWRFVNKNGPVPVHAPELGPCWLWTGASRDNRYGSITDNIAGKTYSTHRLSYQYAFGPIPPDKMVCHRCDVQLCVRPSHLYLCTNQENQRDSYTRGKSRYTVGNNHPKAVLQDSDAEPIRAMRGSGLSYQRIADHYGVSLSTIFEVCNFKNRWR